MRLSRHIYIILTAIALLLCPFAGSAQSQSQKQAQSQTPQRNITIREVSVVADRPMKEIGVQQTKFDSVVLKENVALSFADVLAFNSSIFVTSMVKSVSLISQNTGFRPFLTIA